MPDFSAFSGGSNPLEDVPSYLKQQQNPSGFGAINNMVRALMAGNQGWQNNQKSSPSFALNKTGDDLTSPSNMTPAPAGGDSSPMAVPPDMPATQPQVTAPTAPSMGSGIQATLPQMGSSLPQTSVSAGMPPTPAPMPAAPPVPFTDPNALRAQPTGAASPATAWASALRPPQTAVSRALFAPPPSQGMSG